jgi:hypothetical protein
MKLSKSYLIENLLIKKGAMVRLDENLSFEAMRAKLFYTGNGNDHLAKFFTARKQMMGAVNTQIKLMETKIDYNENGAMEFGFLTMATDYPNSASDDDDHIYTELKDAPISNNSTGALTTPTKSPPAYILTLKIFDFYDMLEELNMVGKEDFTKENMKALLELSQDVKLSCGCTSFWYQGLSYYLTQDNASLIPCTIAPKVWNHIRPDVKVCKHLETLLRPQTINFLLPQMAMAVKKVLVDEELILPQKKWKEK